MTDQPSLPTGDEPALSGAHPADDQRLEPALGGEAALTHIIDSIHAEELGIRFRAIEQLAAVGSERAIDVLEQAANDPNDSVRRRAIRGLGEIPGERVVDILIDRLQNDPDSMARILAMRAVGETGSERAVDPLIHRIQNAGTRWEARFAALALGQIGSPQAIESLFHALDSHRVVRQAVGRAIYLIRLHYPDLVQPFMDQLIEDLFAPPGSNERFRAVEALSNIRPTSVIPRLLAIMQDPEQPLDQRIAAISGLKAIRDRWSSAPLLEFFATTQDGCLRYQAARALTVIRDREAIPVLINLLEHEDWQVRRFAARILGRRDVRSAVPHLIPLLEDSKAPIRKEAADSLRRLYQAGSISQAIEPLTRALTDRAPSVRTAASRALSRIRRRDREHAWAVLQAQDIS